MNVHSEVSQILYKMTKLVEWLSALGVFFGIWFYLIKSPNTLVKENYNILLFSPVILVVLFGVSLTKSSLQNFQFISFSYMPLRPFCTGFTLSMIVRMLQKNCKMYVLYCIIFNSELWIKHFQEIVEAREYLSKEGFKFKEKIK